MTNAEIIDWKERAEKAEAEVERLRDAMKTREEALNQFAGEIEQLKARAEAAEAKLRELEK